MRRNLLWANSLEESLHVSVVGEEDWVGSGVVWVLVATADASNFVGIESLTVFLDVFWLWSVKSVKMIRSWGILS